MRHKKVNLRRGKVLLQFSISSLIQKNYHVLFYDRQSEFWDKSSKICYEEAKIVSQIARIGSK